MVSPPASLPLRLASQWEPWEGRWWWSCLGGAETQATLSGTESLLSSLSQPPSGRAEHEH